MEFAIADGSSGSTPNIPNSCDFVIHGALTGDGSGNYVFLTSNEGFSTIGPGAFGAIGPTGYTTLPNSQCTLLTQASAGSGGYSNDASTYFLNPILITFTPAFTGIKKIYGRITGTDGSVLDPWTFVGYLTIGNPDLTITSSHSSNFTQGQTGATYTLTVGNIGNGSSSGAVTVTDTLPTGLTASAISGTGWSCTLSTLTCTRSDALSATATYPPITVTVNVAANAAASVTNSVSVSGGGESNTANDTGTDPTTITNTVDLVLSGLTFITGPTALFHATNSITATTVVINNTASDSGSVTFQAGSVIKLEPGFHALAGTPAQTFHAFIQ
jgi:hypothetical protein